MNVRKSLVAAAAGLLGVATFVPALANADHGDPQNGCVPYHSFPSDGPRPCVMEQVRIGPTATIGDGVCVGPVTAGGTAYDGPLVDNAYVPNTPVGAEHVVSLHLTAGFWLLPSVPLGACNLTATLHWRNLDTGAAGAETRSVEPYLCINIYCEPELRDRASPTVHLQTGPGRVHIDLTTNHPSVPAGTDVLVP
ncbi:hypothetical protein ACFWUP_07225 [Nocardia sp. NPDC058658]|uniref:hypothetical protein n=1 Tax=Nocardia sp. NPDC058658 TaxID=3346580 RepID=UPI003648B32C